jgi:hypothetical protein
MDKTCGTSCVGTATKNLNEYVICLKYVSSSQ